MYIHVVIQIFWCLVTREMLIHFVGMFRVNCSSIPVLTVWSKQNTIVFGKLQILRLDFLYANVHIGEFVDLLSLSF